MEKFREALRALERQAEVYERLVGSGRAALLSGKRLATLIATVEELRNVLVEASAAPPVAVEEKPVVDEKLKPPAGKP